MGIRMEASYINTGHPDFITGHKAMAIIANRIEAAKPTPIPLDAKSGKLGPGGLLNGGRDLETDLKKEEGFFGSFWPGGKKPNAVKKGGSIEAVSFSLPSLPPFDHFFFRPKTLVERVLMGFFFCC